MKTNGCHLKTAKNMEKYLTEIGFGLNGSEIMKKAACALQDNKTICIPEISVTLHWIYIGDKRRNIDGNNNSKDVNDYMWKLL